MANTAKPERATRGSEAYDMRASKTYIIPAGETTLVDLSYSFDFGFKCFGLLIARSSLHKLGLMLANGVGLIDRDYRGVIKAAVYNFTDKDVVLAEDTRVAQLLVLRSFIVDKETDGFHLGELPIPNQEDSDIRGTGGFGSTGVL